VAPEQVPGRLLAGALELAPGVMASYNEFAPTTTRVTAVHPTDIHTPDKDGAFVELLHQHPVITVHGLAGIHSASTISDYVRPRQLHRLDLYRPLGIADQITSNATGILDLLHPFLALGPAHAAQLTRHAATTARSPATPRTPAPRSSCSPAGAGSPGSRHRRGAFWSTGSATQDGPGFPSSSSVPWRASPEWCRAPSASRAATER
jgi:hypothetical protein